MANHIVRWEKWGDLSIYPTSQVLLDWHSWAGLCVCTHCVVSVHAEPTFERLRYSFGGDRPSQTAHLTLSPTQIHGCRLETQ